MGSGVPVQWRLFSVQEILLAERWVLRCQESCASQREHKHFQETGCSEGDVAGMFAETLRGEDDIGLDEGVKASGLSVQRDEENTRVIQLRGPTSALRVTYEALAYSNR